MSTINYQQSSNGVDCFKYKINWILRQPFEILTNYDFYLSTRENKPSKYKPVPNMIFNSCWFCNKKSTMKLGYNELGYNKLGYNEHLVITKKCFGPK